MNATATAIITDVINTILAANPGHRGGCAIVFVVGVGRKAQNVLRKAGEALGMSYREIPYSGTKGLRIGYDNASGVPYAQATEIVKRLKAEGVDTYVTSWED